MGIRVLIADNHGIVREAICSLLRNDLGVDIVGQAEDGRAAIQLAKELQPDIIIMETSLPNLNGIEATRRIVHELPDVKVIALSAHSDRRSVREMFKAGASGYVPKRCDFQELVSALQNVTSNHIHISSLISGPLIDEAINGTAEHEGSAYSVLTDREREVLQLIAEGKSTKVTARELHVSPKTIDARRRSIASKLGISGIADLTKLAIREGLTSLEF